MRRWRNDLTLDVVIVRPEKAEQEKKSGAEIPGGTGSGFTGGYTGYTGSGGGSWEM